MMPLFGALMPFSLQDFLCCSKKVFVGAYAFEPSDSGWQFLNRCHGFYA
jgi:hypothetical protein